MNYFQVLCADAARTKKAAAKAKAAAAAKAATATKAAKSTAANNEELDKVKWVANEDLGVRERRQ